MACFFETHELDSPYSLRKDVLPSKTDCLLYVLSRTKREYNKISILGDLALEVYEIWDKADCCPYSVKQIKNAFEQHIWQKYLYLKREKCLPGHHLAEKRSHKKSSQKPKLEPVRKSARRGLADEFEEKPVSSHNVTNNDIEVSSMKPATRNSVINLRKIWDEHEGNKLFDILSTDRINKCVKKGLAFDKTFYEDQKSMRTLKMMISKVTDEYKAAEASRMKAEALAQAKNMSAYMSVPRHSGTPCTPEENSETDTEIDDDWREEDIQFKTPTFQSSSKKYLTRNSSLNSTRDDIPLWNAQTQTDSLVPENNDIPVRVLSSSGKCSTLIEPRYLEAISLLMAENFSASEAIKAVAVVDQIVWKQKRHLPLELDKDYINLTQKLNKIKGIGNENVTLASIIVDPPQTELTNDDTLIDEDENVDLIVKSNAHDHDEPEIEKLRFIVNEKIRIRELEREFTLPTRKCVRQNHNLMAVHCEAKVAEEIMKNKCFLMPDGTKRQGLGEVGASVVKVGDKIRSLKISRLSNGTRENWADFIYHLLDRLATASNVDIVEVWENVSAFLSDLCKVNLHLAKNVHQIIGSSWVPGQAFCNLHFTLAVPVGIKEVLAEYQSSIGADKLFPKCVGFEMNLEDKLIVIQILDCWMRLTSIRWQARSWNRYSEFTDFAEKRGILNVGQMLHANRFGEFEVRCAGGLYLADAWKEWLETFTDVRNQLACYLREVSSLMDQCMFLWAGAALIGIHLTFPFMSMLLDHRVTARQLLVILPNLYQNLSNYGDTMCQIQTSGIPALAPYFLDQTLKETTTIGVQVAEKLQSYLLTVNTEAMN